MPEAPHPAFCVVRRVVLAIAACELALVVFVTGTGGFSWAIGGVVLRVHEPWRLLGSAFLLIGIALWLGGAGAVKGDLERAWDERDRCARWLAAAAAVTALLTGLLRGTWTAGSADSYGYVSQSMLWLKGVPVQIDALAQRAPWPLAEWSFSPLGYKPGVDAGAIVPTYPPGLPLTMAGAASIGGTEAVYWVVPALGAAAVWATYLIGRRYAGGAAGAAAAVLLSASPVFLYQVVQPMSDVPVTAWWLLSMWLVARGRPAIAGLCAAAAVLTRPNLAPLAAWLMAGVVVHEWQPSRRPVALWRDAVAFAAPVTLGLGFLFWLNAKLYGSPFASGYGAASSLFAVANIPVNIGHYTRWLVETHTPLVLIGLAAPLTAGIERQRSGTPAPTTAPWWLGLGFIAVVIGSYLPYSSFEEWWYLRFLLPALPVLLILAGAVLLRVSTLLPKAARLVALLAVLGLLATRYIAVADARSAFDLARLESRYVAAGTFAARSLPPNAVLLSVQQSGPLRMYGHRMTVRFDHLEPQGLDSAVRFFEGEGYQPYFALEAWEETQFRNRFSRSSPLGLLDWPPVAEVGNPVKVRFYDPRDRQRFLAGERVTTTRDPRGRFERQ